MKEWLPFTKLHFTTIFQSPEVPPYKWVIIRIDMRGDERPPPVNLKYWNCGFLFEIPIIESNLKVTPKLKEMRHNKNYRLGLRILEIPVCEWTE